MTKNEAIAENAQLRKDNAELRLLLVAMERAAADAWFVTYSASSYSRGREFTDLTRALKLWRDVRGVRKIIQDRILDDAKPSNTQIEESRQMLDALENP